MDRIDRTVSNDETNVFIGDQFLPHVTDFEIWFTDERAAMATITALLPMCKPVFDLIENGVTLDVIHICIGPRLRENGTVIISLKDIFDVEKSVKRIVIASPDDVERLTIMADFKCTLEFSEDWING